MAQYIAALSEGYRRRSLTPAQRAAEDKAAEIQKKNDEINAANAAKEVQIQKDRAAKAEADKKAEEQRKEEAKAAKRQEAQADITNTLIENHQLVANAFGGGSSKTNQNSSVNTNREEAAERAQEYQNTTNSSQENEIADQDNTNNTEIDEQANQNWNKQWLDSYTNSSVNNTGTNSGSKTPTSTDSEYIQGLADDKVNEYKNKWNNGSTNTVDYTSILKNDINQNIGNAGDWKTSFGNNNKLNSVRAGNNYTLNLGNIDTSG